MNQIQRMMKVMSNQEMRKEFGNRIKELRKQRKWTQKELAAKLGIRFSHLNKYESGLHAPPMEKLVLLAELFNTTVDYLLTGDRQEEKPLHNLRLLDRFRAVSDLNIEDQEAVIKLIDAMVFKKNVEGAFDPYEKKITA